MLELLRQGSRKNSGGWLIAGWSSFSIKLLILILVVSKREFGLWVDIPLDHEKNVTFSRKILYLLLKCSRATVFCVGQRALESLKDIGFKDSALKNMRITLSPRVAERSLSAQAAIRTRFGVPKDAFVITTGSRLIKDKGFDILVRAVSLLSQNEIESIHVVIVGKGEREKELLELIDIYDLSKRVKLIRWLEGADFRELVSASNLVVHPSRVDSYGGPTVVALAEGVGVVGATSAGSVAEIVIDGWNGQVYESEDVTELAAILSKVLLDPGLATTWAANMECLSRELLFTPVGMSNVLLSDLGIK